MKLLLDECVDWRLAREFSEHFIKTVPQMGWATIKNGQLLALAEKEFNVFITVDCNLSFQQNLSELNIAVIVLRAKTNRLADLKPLVPQVLAALSTIHIGQITVISG